MGRIKATRSHPRPGIKWCNRRNCWVIDKVWNKRRIYCVTFTADPDAAEALLNTELEKLRQAALFGERPIYCFHHGAERYLEERQNLSTFGDRKAAILRMMPHIGQLALAELHDGTLKPYVQWRKTQGKLTTRRDPETREYIQVRREIRNSSINRELEVVRTILISAWRRWRCDLTGRPWIDSAPIITLLPTKPAKGAPGAEHSAKPYSLSWAEQDALFARLNPRLQRMCLFKVNTGTREQEVCQLRWDWEHEVPELGVSVFIVPEGHVKNGEARLIVMNRIARSVIDEQRRRWQGNNEYVFPNPRTGKPFKTIRTSGWKRAWPLAGLPVDPWVCRGVHNLKHTCGRRLRAAGVPLETRRVCLGHKNGDITTHYSAAEVRELLDAFERLCDRREGIVVRPRLQVVGVGDVSAQEPQKSHTDLTQRCMAGEQLM